MKWGVFALVICLCGGTISKAQEQQSLLPDAPNPQPGIIVGTVFDVNDDTVPRATVALEGPAVRGPRTVISKSNGFFEFKGLEPGTTYHVTISAPGICHLDFTRRHPQARPVHNPEGQQATNRRSDYRNNGVCSGCFP